MPTVLEFDITPDEARQAYQYKQRSMLRAASRGPTPILLALLMWGAIAGTTITLESVVTSAAAARTGLFYYWLVATIFLWIAYRSVISRRVMSHWVGNDSILVGRHVLSFDADGIRQTRPRDESWVRWDAITKIEDTKPGIFFSLGMAMFFFIPRRTFATEQDAQAFMAKLGVLAPAVSLAKDPDLAPSAPVPAADQPRAMARSAGAWSLLDRALAGLRTNLRAGFRLASFLRVPEAQLCASWSQLIALALGSVALGLAVAFAQVGLDGHWTPSGLPGALFHLPIVLVTCWAMAMLARRADKTLLLAVAILAADLWIGAFSWTLAWASQFAPRGFGRAWVSSTVYYLPGYWLGLAAGTAGIRLLGISLYLRWAAYVLAFALLALPLTNIWLDRELWVQNETQESVAGRSAYNAAGGEDVFYLQPKLLDRELGAVVPGPSAKTNLYFIGVAGYSDQDVFMREVESVAKLFRERFATGGRSIVLINNRKTLYETPVASTTALRASLKRVSAVMNRDRDILFLYLSSHGSKDHTFSIRFWPLELRQLDPETLRQMLDETGIKNRVLVVSACYSGGFVDPLKDDNTLIITAAASDKNSFGCSNEADFTYFGKAYFDEALRTTYSFIDAFDLAKRTILAREKKDGYDPSDPQISVGKNIANVLAEMERELRLPAAVPGVATHAKSADDSYAAFVAIWVSQDAIKLSYAQCRRSMAEQSPDHTVEKYPDYYGGIRPGSAYWPRIEAAYERYADTYCQSAADEERYQAAYAQAWRQSISEADLSAILKVLATPLGQRFVEAENRAALQMTDLWREDTRLQREKALRDYEDAMSGLAKEGARKVGQEAKR